MNNENKNIYESLVNLNYLNEDQLVDYFIKNQVPLINIENYFPKSLEIICNNKKYLERINYETYRYLNWHHHYTILTKTLTKNNIKIISHKSVNIKPSFSYTSGNIDALIREYDLKFVRQLLFDLDYIELVNIEEPKKFLFKKFEGCNAVLELHLHTKIGWGVCFIGDEVWSNNLQFADDDNAVLLLSSEDQFLVHLAHSFYENKTLKLYDFIRINTAYVGIKNWDYLLNITTKYGWRQGFFFMLQQCSKLLLQLNPNHPNNQFLKSYMNYQEYDFSFPKTLGFVLSKKLYYKKIWSDKTTKLERKFYETISTLLWGAELKLNIKAQNSFFITFSGLDGSGKTTQIEYLIKIMKSCDLKVNYIWRRMADSFLTSTLIKIGKIFLKRNRKNNSYYFRLKEDANYNYESRQSFLQIRIVRLLWKWIIAADLTVIYFFKICLPLLFGKIVICDRYIYDALIELSCIYQSDMISTKFAKIFYLINPNPDFSIYLDITPEEILERNVMIEEGSKFLIDSKFYYDRLIKSKKHKIYNGSLSEETLSTKISCDVLRMYYKSYSPLGKKLLLATTSQMNPKVTK